VKTIVLMFFCKTGQDHNFLIVDDASVKCHWHIKFVNTVEFGGWLTADRKFGLFRPFGFNYAGFGLWFGLGLASLGFSLNLLILRAYGDDILTNLTW